MNSKLASIGSTGRLRSSNWCSQCNQTIVFHAPAECLGVGLVRACDAAEGLLYILTPLRLNTLQRVNLLQVPTLCHIHIRSERQPDFPLCWWRMTACRLYQARMRFWGAE